MAVTRTCNKTRPGIRRPRRRQPGEGAATARAFRFLELALSPRMLLIGGGLAFMVRAHVVALFSRGCRGRST